MASPDDLKLAWIKAEQEAWDAYKFWQQKKEAAEKAKAKYAEVYINEVKDANSEQVRG